MASTNLDFYRRPRVVARRRSRGACELLAGTDAAFNIYQEPRRGPSARSSTLHARVRAFGDAFERGLAMPESFDALACDLARPRPTTCPASRGSRLRAAWTSHPRARRRRAALHRPMYAPAKPTRVATFDEVDARVTFRTSGTDNRHTRRSCHPRRGDVRSRVDRVRPHVARARSRAPRSGRRSRSVSARRARVVAHAHVRRLRSHVREISAARGDVDEGRRDRSYGVRRARHGIADAMGEPVLVLGTSFAFVHFLEALDDATFALFRQAAA